MTVPTGVLLDQWDERTSAFLASRSWDPSASVLLLAVSGGADSIALLHWARRSAPAYGCSLAVAHVDHGLRPGSREDSEFVSRLCDRFGIPFFLRRLDPGRRRPRESMEMWARRERYGFFEDAARDAGATWILTAHHRDDLVETVFQRLGRGTGPRGLKGIPFRRGGIVRPFLNRSRAEILAYLGLMEADWREDESNADIGIDRNWYRHRFLPGLRLSEPGLDERIHSMAMTIQEIGKGIDALEAEEGLLQTDGEGEPYLTRDGVEAKVAAGDLEGLEFWMRTLLTSERADPEGLGASRSSAGLSHTAPSIGSIPVTKEILREFCRQWEIGPESLQVPLNRILALKCQNNGVYRAERALAASNGRGRPKKTCSPEAQRVILVGGSASAEWRWGDRSYSLVARRFPRPAGLDFPSDMEERAIFDADLISCTLLIRTRKDGDRFSPLGIVSRSRKLKTFFNEEKVPTGMRDVIPIVFSGEMPGDETLAWVPGYGISDFFKVSGSTSHILELVLTCENP